MAHEEGHPLHVTEPGSKIGVSGDEFTVTLRQEVVGKARVMETSQVCIHGNVQMSTQAIRECARLGIPVAFFSYGNWFSAGLHGLPHKNVELRQQQFKAASDSAASLTLARAFVSSKISNQRVLLRRNAKNLAAGVLEELLRLRRAAEAAKSMESLLGIEGMAAKHYFGSFSKMLKSKNLIFSTRNRRRPHRPPQRHALFLLRDAVQRSDGFLAPGGV